MDKRTLVIGASDHPYRYSFKAVNRLKGKGYTAIPLGIREGAINGIAIETAKKNFQDIDTVTLYIRPAIQKEYYDYILNVIQPKRIIFNPGSENPELKRLAQDSGIEVIEACTLVMLSSGSY